MKKLLLIIFITLLVGCTMFERKFVVGKDISNKDINEFYYTYSTSTDPAVYQRYHFYKENDQYYFFHEYREGSAFPLTEQYTKESGKVLLDNDKIDKFFKFIENGVVTKRKENTDSGSSGPWLYIYWKNDKGKYQVFDFESYSKLKEFEEFCVSLKNN